MAWSAAAEHVSDLDEAEHAFKILIRTVNKASYSASKGAVSNLTRQVALDYAADRIHCNAICPACRLHVLPSSTLSTTLTNHNHVHYETVINTQLYADLAEKRDMSKIIHAMQPFGGLGQPSDVVGAAVFLASDEARFITGSCLSVDGGFTAQ